MLERWLQNLKGDTHKDTSSGENGDTHKDTSFGENGDTSDAGKETPAADNGDTCKDTPAGDPSDITEDMPAGDEGKVTPASDTTMVTPAGDSGVCVSCLGVLQQGHCSIEFLDKVSLCPVVVLVVTVRDTHTLSPVDCMLIITVR